MLLSIDGVEVVLLFWLTGVIIGLSIFFFERRSAYERLRGLLCAQRCVRDRGVCAGVCVCVCVCACLLGFACVLGCWVRDW